MKRLINCIRSIYDTCKDVISVFFSVIFLAFFPLGMAYWSDVEIGYNIRSINKLYYVAEVLLTVFVITANTYVCLKASSGKKRRDWETVCLYLLFFGGCFCIWFYRDFHQAGADSEQSRIILGGRRVFDLLSVRTALSLLALNYMINFVIKSRTKKNHKDIDGKLSGYSSQINEINRILSQWHDQDDELVKKLKSVIKEA